MFGFTWVLDTDRDLRHGRGLSGAPVAPPGPPHPPPDRRHCPEATEATAARPFSLPIKTFFFVLLCFVYVLIYFLLRNIVGLEGVWIMASVPGPHVPGAESSALTRGRVYVA